MMLAMAVRPADTDRGPPPARADGAAPPLDFPSVYEAWFDPVCRWARAAGCPEADLDDVAQEVFLVVRRKLAAFDGRNLAGWLYTITARTTSDHRRRAWFRNLLGRPRDVELDDLPSDGHGHGGEDPARALERKEDQRLVWRLLDEMSEKRRVAFALFEIEGYSGEEIAELLDVPVATVWTRLHHARKDFVALVARHEGARRR
jgi:RNA polymerase sigma-70 factor (ECF subfamily)